MLLSLLDVSLALGGEPLLDHAQLSIDAGERVGLVGRNGSGKSTLLKLIAGEIQPDSGEIQRRQGLVVARVAQDVPEQLSGTVFQVVAAGAGDLGQLVADYHEASVATARRADAATLARLEASQARLEARDGWSLNRRIEALLEQLRLPAEAAFAELSGGLKRRVMLGRAFAAEPHLLLLDEPTNHLDMEAIGGLEDFLLDWPGACLFVTHDRAFLQRLATRIVDLDRGRLSSWPGDFATYVERRDAELRAEERAAAAFDKRLASEEAWIRQGIKARRTRNEGRVRALERMREERRARRVRSGRADLVVNAAAASGDLVIEAAGVQLAYGDRCILRDLNVSVMRGDRIGTIGPNGVGKTSLLRVLLGELPPDRGQVRHGTRLEVAYFDQLRAALQEDLSVLDNVAQGSDTVTVNGRRRHIISYLRDFLFEPDRARMPVRALSGGERSRLLLARLFTRPANLLVLDEPTNDLDFETLELLEEQLALFQGTVLLVSHDRAFLDNVVTSVLVFEGEGRVAEYVGGHADWLRKHAPRAAEPPRKSAPRPPATTPRRQASVRLSYKERRELEALPALIEELERTQAALQARLADPGFYRSGAGAQVADAQAELAAIDDALAQAYTRWEALEAKEALGA